MTGKETYATFADPSSSPKGTSPPVQRHPQQAASWLSRRLLGWVTPLMALGNAKQLSEDDAWPLQHEHQAAVVSVKFARDFKRTQSIPRAFLASFGWRFVGTGFAFLFSTAALLAGPLVLNHVVEELSTGEYDVQDLAKWIIGLLVTQLLQALADTYANFESEVIAIQFTAAVENLMYDKLLKLNAEARKDKSTGDLTNLFTMDCSMILAVAYYVHQLWVVPLQIAIVGIMLHRLLGAASFAGFGVIFLVFVLSNLVMFGMFGSYMAAMKAKDARMKAVTEAFKAISIIKFNAWEDKFLERIGAERAQEISATWGFVKMQAVAVVFTWGLPVFISVAVFSVYTGSMHKPLTPAVVFTSIALFQLIQSPLAQMPGIIAASVQAKIAESRIGKYLALPEIDGDNVLTVNHIEADAYIATNVIVAVENGTFAWDTESPLLKNINLHVNVGDFVVVHGPVGSGKSSLCSALLGDMVKTHGQVYVGGSVAYCSQQPWIQHATVRDNILFGRPYDRKKYEKVLDACALTTDLQSLPAGDRTEIGERGVNLSGGQKARVALARACYSDASVYILDAPLSAVDAIVQNEIFQKCLLGLLRHRTIVLVTHNPEIIASEYVSRAVTISESGEVVETRSLVGDRPVYSPLVTPLASHAYTKTYDEIPINTLEEKKLLDEKARIGLSEVRELNDLALGIKSPLPQQATSFVDYEEERKPSAKKDETHRLVDDEERKEGRVGFHVFEAYYRAVGGFPVLFIVLLSQVVWQVLQISSDFWLSDWSNDANAKADAPVVSESYRVRIYTILGLSSAFVVILRSMTVSYFGLGAAKRLFDRMTSSLMHAPMAFFDSNPIGRILMRYSDDVGDVDVSVPLSFGSLIAQLFSVGFTIATMGVIIGWRGVFLLPIVVLYANVGNFYLQPAREMERVLRTCDAPILSHLSESVEGGATIRAFGSKTVSRFRTANDTKLDVANKVTYARLAISQWFALRMQLLGCALDFVVAISLVLLHDRLSAAIVGLAFSYVLRVSTSIEQIVQTWSRVETAMVSPERMQQYIDIEQEAPHKIPSMDPPASAHWPATGAIAFNNVSFRYKDTDKLVLKNLTFSVRGGEKIGIVGRTGAGKSSLTMALFRINELAGGSICIDGVDSSKIGLKTLREHMSIIPQNPVLFKGPLRKYLDPFDEYSDAQLWDCIRRVGLSERISGEDDKLEYTVEENGENFSVGERQMLCMSRALLRESRIVIFDEATAAIDHETDQKLQRVIREAFGGSTVLTIAHRLDTILDSDRILVLDGGEVVACASPSALMSKGSGHFFELMQEGGYLDKFTGVGKTAASA